MIRKDLLYKSYLQSPLIEFYMIFTGKLPVSPPSKRLLDQLYNQIRIKHYPSRTEEAYAYWVREFILFHKAKSGTFRHPGEMGISEVNQFLTHLAVDRKGAV